MMLILNVVYVLIAIAIIALVLMQRGSGAQAGSGFGAGASGTVFGARGASNFLSKSTKWLAIAFFGITLFMAWHASHSARPTTQQNLGVMTQQQAPAGAPAAGELSVPAQPTTVPAAPAAQPQAAPTTVPAAPAPATGSQPQQDLPPVEAPSQGG
ncbi:preprotein translocase subunit SecG [Pseudoxanthomonas sp. z9]|uniref:preprotein translocase subunit SecG n=1 Tax=Pseudoxanthomonas sp. z9 TaxID=2584942 RepID=UPI002101E927|nr:preprotein translocase subunit SecG [Pseudoxanthomonas sp. z9]